MHVLFAMDFAKSVLLLTLTKTGHLRSKDNKPTGPGCTFDKRTRPSTRDACLQNGQKPLAPGAGYRLGGLLVLRCLGFIRPQDGLKLGLREQLRQAIV